MTAAVREDLKGLVMEGRTALGMLAATGGLVAQKEARCYTHTGAEHPVACLYWSKTIFSDLSLAIGTSCCVCTG